MRKGMLLMVGLSAALRVTAQELGPAPGKLVDIGGRRLHLLCSGSGAPTVVLEAGSSAFAIDWTLVQRDIARGNRVCSYDRAGSGWSDRAPPYPAPSVQQDLHALLQAAGEPGPYVLVGASAGGLHIRHYQADYPAEVAGMVFVDPATEDRLFTYYQGQGVLIGSLTAEQLRSTFPTRPVAVPRRKPQTGAPFDQLPPELYAQRILLDQRLIAAIPDTVTLEMVGRAQETERARLARMLAIRAASPHPYGELPLVVLTRGVDSDPEPRGVHEALARLSGNSRHRVIPGSGHEIHLFEPAAVIQAINEVVQAVRGGGKLPPA